MKRLIPNQPIASVNRIIPVKLNHSGIAVVVSIIVYLKASLIYTRGLNKTSPLIMGRGVKDCQLKKTAPVKMIGIRNPGNIAAICMGFTIVPTSRPKEADATELKAKIRISSKISKLDMEKLR